MDYSFLNKFLNRRRLLQAAAVLLGIFLLWPVQGPFPDCYSKIILDRNGRLLRVFLAEDGQFRFPPSDQPLPAKYITCLLNYEDRRFYMHPGVDPLAAGKALVINLRHGRRIRGGSTLTMQVARLARPKSRTYWHKLSEMLTALRLTVHCSKNRILRAYCAHVPMGGNLIGIETASYRYFGKSWESLTWAEAALFVVLPNAPGRINLKKGREILHEKRNRLLMMLRDRQLIDSLTCALSCSEPLPGSGRYFPFSAPHFAQFALSVPGENPVRTSLDERIQNQTETLIRYHVSALKDQGIANLAVLIAETSTGKIRAYAGSQSFTDSLRQGQIDGVQSRRSTGSLLKPFLAANVLDRGPHTLESVLYDIPTFYGTFTPQNASRQFSGLATLRQMLVHSLNVPAIRLLNYYGLEDFYSRLKSSGLNGLFRSAHGYGLPLILGGAEASLWELVQLYTGLGNLGDPVRLSVTADTAVYRGKERLFSRGAAWLILNALSGLNRPGSEYYWQNFNHQIPVAWKTGTSYGQKDGWAIGVNAQWVIGVWVGNFTGEGNAAISGAGSAAPLLFDLFNQLTRESAMWFDEPESDLTDVTCCAQSGFPAGPHCPATRVVQRPVSAWRPGICPFHQSFMIDRNTQRSVCSLCWEEADTVRIQSFIVPPAVREILQNQGLPADTLPAHTAFCPGSRMKNRLEIVYPLPNIKVLIPRDMDGEYQKIVFSVKHQQNHARCFWFLNGQFLDETIGLHILAVDLNPGDYELTVQDEEGYIEKTFFTAYKNQ